ncbi:MAG: FAD-dependent oxidoreductase [Clostridia bacterium]|nr:FAD-dependent oxidoreductase [Clostridia bacterium]
MRYLKETLTTPVAGEYDVIVVGGGPAGACAGIAAARAGARTLVVEKMLYLGGMWTGGLVNPLFDYAQKKGILGELIGDLKKRNSWGGFWKMCFGYENMKELLESKLLDAGGEVLYQTMFCRTIVEDGRVCGVVCENMDGRRAFMGKVVIDCTGDANVAHSAGLPTFVGREGDGLCQAMTLMFTIGNVDFLQDKANELFDMVEEANAVEDTGYRLPFTKPFIIQIPNTRHAVVQLTHMRGYDPTSASDLTKAAIEGRRQAMEVVNFLKARVERFRDIELLETAPLLGVRESRRIAGEYTIDRNDLIDGGRHEDDITTASFGVDIHDPSSTNQKCYGVKRYGIPYRSLIPKGIEGLLVAGRCISGTSEAMASYRVTGNCAAMGEAAGAAAAEAAMQGIGVRDVKIGDIVKHIDGGI